MKAIDFTSDKVFVKYVDPQRPLPEEVVIQVKAASFDVIRQWDNKIVVTDVVGTVQTEKGNLKSGSWVTALLPIDRESSLPEFLPVPISNIGILSDNVDSFDVILSIQSAVRAYIALVVQASAAAGQTVLILDGANANNFVLLQLAVQAGCKVLTTVQNIEEEQSLQITDKIKVGNVGVPGWKNLERFVAEETNELGVDFIVDNGIQQAAEKSETSVPTWKPEKFELINCLAPFGKWLTIEQNLQLDPPESGAMFGKSVSLVFLNHQAWLLSNYRQGVLLQIVDDTVKKIEKRLIKPPKYEIVSLKELESFGTLPNLFDPTKCHLLKMF